MEVIGSVVLRKQLVKRRKRLEQALRSSGQESHLVHLLQEVDAALERIEAGSYGQCEVCLGTIEGGRIMADPTSRVCLDCLSPNQRVALERDLELASQIQRSLLPKRTWNLQGWELDYHYEPAGLVSGDYCDVLSSDDAEGGLMFVLADVAGKGVAASMLMAQLHAMFHSLASLRLPPAALIERANCLFCGSTMASFHYATLIAGSLCPSGEVELCNAGHCSALWIREDGVTALESNGFPMGLFHDGHYGSTSIRLAHGDTLLLYTDGLTEARDASGEEYGLERLTDLAAQHRKYGPSELIGACLEDLSSFRQATPCGDDLTVMALRRA